MKRFVLIFLSAGLLSNLQAQQWDESYANAPTNIRYESSNPTRLSYNEHYNHGVAVADFLSQNGHFHAADRSGDVRNLGVYIGGLRRIGKLDLGGHIRYSNLKENDLQWRSTLWLDPLNPFAICDSVSSDITTESFDLGAAASFQFSSRLKGALEINLQTGTLSGQSDPRPKTHTSVIPITAGVEYQFAPRWTVGASVGINLYHSTIEYTNINPLLYRTYFLMKGIGDNYTRSSNDDAAYQRKYRGATWSGALQATWAGEGMADFIEVRIASGNQDATDGGSSYKFKGGDYKSTKMGLTNRFQLKTARTLQNLTLAANFQKGEGTWYDQKRMIDTEHANRLYYTILDKYKIHDVTAFDASLQYRIDFLKENAARNIYIEAGATFKNVTAKHYLNTETPQQEIGSLDLQASVGKIFHPGKVTLLAELGGGYSMPTTTTYANGSDFGEGDGITAPYTRRQFEYSSAGKALLKALVDAQMPIGKDLKVGAFAKGSCLFYTGDEENWIGYKSTSYTTAQVGVYLNF